MAAARLTVAVVHYLLVDAECVDRLRALDLLQLPVAVEAVARAVGRELADDFISGKVGWRVGL